jgi:hypothetical protein
VRQHSQLFAGSVTWVVRLPDGLAGSALPASPEALQSLLRAQSVCSADCRLDEGLRAFLRAVLADEWLPL